MSASSKAKSSPVSYLCKITFLDHCASIGGMNEPIECIVYGVIVHEDKNAYYVSSWVSSSGVDENMDTHTILKKVISKLERIRREAVKLHS